LPVYLLKQCFSFALLLSVILSCASTEGQIDQYLNELCTMPHSEEEALAFWSKRHVSYPLLAPLAEDLLVPPALQAYVERVFSVCGWLTAGHRNRLKRTWRNGFL